MRAVGGESSNSATLAPKIGPLGLVSLYTQTSHLFTTLYVYLGAKEGGGGHRQVYPGVQGTQSNCEANNPEQTGRGRDRAKC